MFFESVAILKIYLHSLKELLITSAKWMKGFDENDKTYFAYSEKGIKNLTRKARKRDKKVGNRGRLKQDWMPVLTLRNTVSHTFEALLNST